MVKPTHKTAKKATPNNTTTSTTKTRRKRTKMRKTRTRTMTSTEKTTTVAANTMNPKNSIPSYLATLALPFPAHFAISRLCTSTVGIFLLLRYM